MLKMSLNEIRGKIQIHPENWINIYTTNCYAYALGLDVSESDICESAYQPGSMSEASNPIKNIKYFDYDLLIENIEEDFKFLGFSYEEVSPDYKMKDNEWKIALFTERYYEKAVDFHFLREKPNGIWFHKNGFEGAPSKRDYRGQIITNPTTCNLIFYEYKKCYALRLNK